ncbi:MAG: hypothetical protein WD066_12680 [Planctomycetaceae bacterium]
MRPRFTTAIVATAAVLAAVAGALLRWDQPLPYLLVATLFGSIVAGLVAHSIVHRGDRLKNLKSLHRVWFPSHFALLGVLLAASIILLEGSARIFAIALALVGTLLLTRMFLAFRIEFEAARTGGDRMP